MKKLIPNISKMEMSGEPPKKSKNTQVKEGIEFGMNNILPLVNPLGGKGLSTVTKGVSKVLPAIGEYLTTKTPLKNASKLNPLAFKAKEGMMYRGLGKEGVIDAISSGVFRSKQNVEPSLVGGLDIAKRFGNNPYFTPRFKVAESYGSKYLAEVPKDVANWKQRYKRNDWSQIADKPIPIKEGRILKKDWLKGYKPINK
jgi:hypothetical protein